MWTTKSRKQILHLRIVAHLLALALDVKRILPTPAAAPDTAAQIDKCCVTAVLAFSHENQNETFYVADTDRDGDCTLTQDLSLAFRFRWHRDAEPQKRGILECWVSHTIRHPVQS